MACTMPYDQTQRHSAASQQWGDRGAIMNYQRDDSKQTHMMHVITYAQASSRGLVTQTTALAVALPPTTGPAVAPSAGLQPAAWLAG